jgi:hypothetical protein
MIQLVEDVAAYLDAQADRNGGSVSSEIGRVFRQMMDADAKARAGRAGARE